MLIIKACGIQGEDQECEVIKQQADLYGVPVKVITPSSKDALRKALSSGEEHDYIYLSTHGNDQGICNHDSSLDVSWRELGEILCESECMNEDCLLMLSCCRGGLNQVAYTLFYCCPNISYVIGPRQSLTTPEMLIAYNVLMYNTINRDVDPVVSCKKVEAATDLRMVCFDRLEVEAEASYVLMAEKFDRENSDDLETSETTVKDLLGFEDGTKINQD
jgi:hypothetical protein